MRLIGLCLVCLSVATAAQAQITGSSTRVTDFAGDQLDPSIDGDIVVYTDRGGVDDDVRYVDLNNDVTVAANHVFVSSGAGNQRLHDISGDTIVYTDLGSGSERVFKYDVVTGISEEIVVSASNPTIDGDLVVFQSTLGAAGSTDIRLVDLTDAVPTVVDVTTTAEYERNPSVGGQYVVFERTSTTSPTSAPVVIVHDLLTGTEVNLGFGNEPHTDGKTVVFSGFSGLDDDIFLYEIGSPGSLRGLTRTGAQSRPRVDGDYLAFDEMSGSEQDVVVMNWQTGDSTNIDVDAGISFETLNDLSGNRVAFTTLSLSTNGEDIYVFEFDIDEPPPGPTTDNPCADQTGLTLVETMVFERQRGAPVVDSRTFDADVNEAVIVVRNDRCASAVVDLNGERIISPNQLDAEATCDYGVTPLSGTNTIDAELRSAPGCTLTVEVYSVDDPGATAPGCSQQSASGMMPFAWFGLLLIAYRRRRG